MSKTASILFGWRTVIICVLFTVAHLPCVAQITFPRDTDLCQHAPWRLVFHDEFEGDTLDLHKWITYTPVWSDDLADFYKTPPLDKPDAAREMLKVDDYRSFYTPQNIVVGGGNCNITYRYQPQDTFGASAHFTTGKLFHKQPFQSGRFDIRCKIPRVGGIWAAFWMMGVNGCNDPHPGGGEIDCFEYTPCETDLNKVSSSLTGYKRNGCNGPELSTTEHYELDAIDDWHIFSTEWDRNFVRCYVDGVLKIDQPRYAFAKATSDCHPGEDRNNGHWEERKDIFPFYDTLHGQCLMAELKSSPDLYTVNFMGICTPSMRSHDYIDAHTADRVWVIDYIRAYQRQDNIQKGLVDLCPEIIGAKTICNNTGDVYTYKVTNYKSISNFKWVPGDGIRVLNYNDSTIDVIFEGTGNSQIAAQWTAAETGCEERSYILPVRIGPPAQPLTSVVVEDIATGFLNKVNVVGCANNTSYNWAIFGNPETVRRRGSEITYNSNYKPLQYTVRAVNDCGSSEYSTGPFDASKIEHEASLLSPNPARDRLYLHFSKDMYSVNNSIVLSVVNIYGQKIMEKELLLQDVDPTLDISNLPCGAYTLVVSGNSKNVYRFQKI